MYISRLTIQGFKSFGKKTDFYFNKSITAIVGPNGSGKSNITEAIRFVLGEQSFKSIRTKEVTDLLFRGADSKANQLSVSLEFKDVAKLSNLAESIILKNALEQDELEISRIVYADGKNLYKLNNNEVRLKDITELMSLLSLGSKSNWHISQGESDKILLASAEDRRVIVEDALGLKIFHTKIQDSNKKLEKAKLNIKEAELKRRELAPELNLLSRQIDKITKVKAYKEEFLKIFKTYYLSQSHHIAKLEDDFKNHGSVSNWEVKKNILSEKIKLSEQNLNSARTHDTLHLENQKSEEEKLLIVLKNNQSKLESEIRNVEAIIGYNNLELQKIHQELDAVIMDLESLSQNNTEKLFKQIDINALQYNINNLQANLQIDNYKQIFQSVQIALQSFLNSGIAVSKDTAKEVAYLQSVQNRLENRLNLAQTELQKATDKNKDLQPEKDKINLQIKIVEENIAKLFAEITEYRFRGSEMERDIEKQKSEFRDLENSIEKAHRLEYVYKTEEKKLDERNYELKRIFGINFDIKTFIETNDVHSNLTTQEISDHERQIERLKLKIEDSQVENIDEVQVSFEQMSARDKFLSGEIVDLHDSIRNLETLIMDLESRLKIDFEKGINEINTHFNQYVQKLFSGGRGEIKISEQKRSTKEDGSESVLEDGIKLGVEVEVDLPKKKVKGLHSLSGGERALVSIALTVAILSNNPSPFMILDEADATLDEANAHRYGDLLTLMKEKTKLIVVTHNRETMSFADEVYGITLEKSGCSQVLSVSFESALAYAK